MKMLSPERRLASFLLVINISLAALSLVEPLILGHMIDVLGQAEINQSGYFSDIFPLFLLWLALGLAMVGLSFFTGLHADRMSQRMRIRAIRDFTAHSLKLSIPFHERTTAPRILQILFEGTQTLWVIWFSFFRENCASFVILLLLCPVTMILNWRLSIPLITLVFCTYLIFSVALIKTETMQAEADQINSDMLSRSSDLLSNVKLIQAFDRAEQEIYDLAELQSNFLQKQYPLLKFWAMIVTAGRAASVLSLVLIFGYGFWLHEQGRASIGEIVSFAFIAQAAISRLDAVSIFLSTVFQQKPKLQSFFELLAEKDPFAFFEKNTAYPHLRGQIVFENVSFSYPNGNEALKNISLTINPGVMTALVGKSGSGKSTIFALLCRFYEPTCGRILIDDMPITKIPIDALRRDIAIMFQDSPILDRTFEENIKFGSYANSLQDIENAMRSAAIYDLYLREKAKGLPEAKSLKTISLSGGERQRLALARVFLKNAPIILLDEPTSAADGITEAQIQRALDSIVSSKTSVIIAHRLATVRRADKIIVIDAGRVAESGTFDELNERGRLFSQLLKTQFSTCADAEASAKTL